MSIVLYKKITINRIIYIQYAKVHTMEFYNINTSYMEYHYNHMY